MLALDEALGDPESERDEWLRGGMQDDEQLAETLRAARARLYEVDYDDDVLDLCSRLADAFNAAGHRGDYVVALAARARGGAHRSVANRAHTRGERCADGAPASACGRCREGGQADWTAEDDAVLHDLLAPTSSV